MERPKSLMEPKGPDSDGAENVAAKATKDVGIRLVHDIVVIGADRKCKID
jgi:hypothetical protein